MDAKQIEKKFAEHDELIESLGYAIGEFTEKQQTQIKQAIDHLVECITPIVVERVKEELKHG